jgi:DNA repair exonuclease SbcCD nuclease subunit
MRIIIESDAQFNPWKEFSKILPNGRNSRLEDQLNAQSEIFKYSVDVGANILVHNGDLFDALTEKIDKTTFLAVYNLFVDFSEKGVIVVLNVGNHDWITRAEENHIIEPFREIKNVLVVDKPHIEIIDDVCLSFVPSTRTDFQKKVQEVLYTKVGFKKYLFTHQDVTGAKSGPRDMPLKFKYAADDFCPNYFDLVFNGHFHKPQWLKSNFIIIGSPIQKDFGERADAKGFWFLDTDEAPKNPKFIETNAPRFFKIEISKEEFAEKGLANRLPKEYVKERDFLWILTDSTRISESPLISDKVRLDLQEEDEFKLRCNININMAIEDQITSYVRMKENKLDIARLIQMGIDKWKRSG